MQLSIAIPTYEFHGLGWLYLSELLNSIAKQTYKDIEIVISDQSTDDKIKQLCSLYFSELNIKYVSGHHLTRSLSSNANNAILNCSNDYIKVICQDDFFIDNYAIEKIIKVFNTYNSKWIVCGSYSSKSIHFMTNKLIPRYTEGLKYGINTISSPSVLAFFGKELFDEKLIMMVDCDMYVRLHDKYGEPYIINDLLICNRTHDKQMQQFYQHVVADEVNYCLNKYKGD